MKLRAIRRRANAAQWVFQGRWFRTWQTALMWKRTLPESVRQALDELARIDRELGLYGEIDE